MPLKRYLTICYFVTVALLLGAGAMISIADPKTKFLSWLVISPIIAAVNTFVQIWPFARMTPESRRLGFWSYKLPSILFIALPFSMLVLGILAYVWDVLAKA